MLFSKVQNENFILQMDGFDATQHQTLGNFVINRCDIIMAIN